MNFKRFHESKNLFDEIYPNIVNDMPKYKSIYVGDGDFTLSTNCPRYTTAAAMLFLLAGNVSGGASTSNNGVSVGISKTVTAVNGYVTIAYRYYPGLDPRDYQTMLNLGSTALPYEPYSSEAWHDIPHYIHNTSTDTITTPADIYANDNNATVGLKGNMSQSGTPTPDNPIQPQECGDLETEGTKAGQYKIPILSNGITTNVYLGEVPTMRRIQKLVLTGEEDWSEYPNKSFAYQANFSTGTRWATTASVCTHYSLAPNTETFWNNNYTMSQDIVYIKNDSMLSLTDFKSHLAEQYAAGTPVTIWYVLAILKTGVVNEPIRKIGYYADTVSGITIPTIAGANTISVDTTLQPSEVTVNYKGWHPVADVHEAENGQWD